MEHGWESRRVSRSSVPSWRGWQGLGAGLLPLPTWADLARAGSALGSPGLRAEAGTGPLGARDSPSYRCCLFQNCRPGDPAWQPPTEQHPADRFPHVAKRAGARCELAIGLWVTPALILCLKIAVSGDSFWRRRMSTFSFSFWSQDSTGVVIALAGGRQGAEAREGASGLELSSLGEPSEVWPAPLCVQREKQASSVRPAWSLQPQDAALQVKGVLQDRRWCGGPCTSSSPWAWATLSVMGAPVAHLCSRCLATPLVCPSRGPGDRAQFSRTTRASMALSGQSVLSSPRFRIAPLSCAPPLSAHQLSHGVCHFGKQAGAQPVLLPEAPPRLCGCTGMASIFSLLILKTSKYKNREKECNDPAHPCLPAPPVPCWKLISFPLFPLPLAPTLGGQKRTPESVLFYP